MAKATNLLLSKMAKANCFYLTWSKPPAFIKNEKVNDFIYDGQSHLLFVKNGQSHPPAFNTTPAFNKNG
jgi:hypothetical protein